MDMDTYTDTDTVRDNFDGQLTKKSFETVNFFKATKLIFERWALFKFNNMRRHIKLTF
jgi:hypothetical protein